MIKLQLVNVSHYPYLQNQIIVIIASQAQTRSSIRLDVKAVEQG